MGELSALVKATLGDSIDERTVDALVHTQAAMKRGQAHLVHLLDTHEISPDDYLIRLNALLRMWMEHSEKLLGTERFHIIFGEAGDHPEDLIDVEAFFQDQSPRRRA